MGVLAVPAFATVPTKITITSSVSKAYRGDEIIFTVNISGDNMWTSAGLMMLHEGYDTSVYEFVKGRVTPAAKIATDGDAVFSFNYQGGVIQYAAEDITTALSLDIFEFTLRVKSDAALGLLRF